MKHKLEERLDLIEETNSERFASLEETIEENKVSNNQKLESLVETTAIINEVCVLLFCRCLFISEYILKLKLF